MSSSLTELESLLSDIDVDEFSNVDSYINTIGTIQRKCYDYVSKNYADLDLSAEDIRQLSTAIFIQTCRKFNF